MRKPSRLFRIDMQIRSGEDRSGELSKITEFSIDIWKSKEQREQRNYVYDVNELQFSAFFENKGLYASPNVIEGMGAESSEQVNSYSLREQEENRRERTKHTKGNANNTQRKGQLGAKGRGINCKLPEDRYGKDGTGGFAMLEVAIAWRRPAKPRPPTETSTQK